MPDCRISQFPGQERPIFQPYRKIPWQELPVSRRPEAAPICRNVPSFLLLTTMTLFLSVHYVKTERRRKAEYSLMMMRFRSWSEAAMREPRRWSSAVMRGHTANRIKFSISMNSHAGVPASFRGVTMRRLCLNHASMLRSLRWKTAGWLQWIFRLPPRELILRRLPKYFSMLSAFTETDVTAGFCRHGLHILRCRL